ncbi:substrate-binding domain-containing protein [Nakamurella sp. YIM 132087]|uniref:Substrate-binding domain-containing protein n=1 Tax=Nakamurella alba TaxID=2665158 RepID=A0A7K1FEV7_9ACTN|nr:LacI family DNA-binding transcriptional regulator [Nakamurella alba]MTD12628.1 substrate-binding domain-containing protein [Nakamurella alba]
MPTIYEVARLAGVSPATVSRVFNGVSVNPDYADRVRAAAAELRFTPNRTARRLRRRSSEVIALIIPDIENPFFTSLARGVEDRAQQAGYSVVLCDSDEHHDKEATYLDVVHAEHMAGVILVPATDHPQLDRLLGQGTPAVAVDRSVPGHPVDAVLLDNETIGRQATERLYARGFRRVACITGPHGTETAQQRAAGWQAEFTRRHRRVDPDRYLEHGDYRVGGGRAAMTALLSLRTPPDAVVVANNSMTVGALEVLQERDISPAELGMACVGDLPYSVLQRSGVEVLPLPARALGTAAADLLLARIAGETGPPQRVVMPV